MNGECAFIAIFMFIGSIVGLVIGCLFGESQGISYVQHQAIELGYAQHSPITGDFEWKENK